MSPTNGRKSLITAGIAADTGAKGENMEEELEGFLNTEATEVEVEKTEAPETPEAAAPTETEVRARDEKGRFAPKGAEKSEEAESPAATEPQLDHAALIGERRRRQEAEDRLRQLEETIRSTQQAPQQQAPQPEAAIPDRWEDPEGYDRWLVDQATNQATRAAMEAAEQRYAVQRIAMSAEEAKAKYPDYLDKKSVFEQMAQVNPMLLEEMIRHPNPAQYAYDVAKTQLELQQYGGLEGLIEARIKAREVQQPPAPIPETLASEQSGRAITGGPNGAPSLEDILNR